MAAALLLVVLALQASPSGSDPGDAGGGEVAELRRAYEQSCGQRAYGTFDDVCNQMADQIRDRERELARAARHRPPPPPARPPAPAAPLRAETADPAVGTPAAAVR